MQLLSPLQQATTFAHDANGRATRGTTPDNHVFSFKHDATEAKGAPGATAAPGAGR